jgi:hypothetical protein
MDVVSRVTIVSFLESDIGLEHGSSIGRVYSWFIYHTYTNTRLYSLEALRSG